MHFVKTVSLFLSHKHHEHQLSVNFHVTIEFAEEEESQKTKEKLRHTLQEKVLLLPSIF